MKALVGDDCYAAMDKSAEHLINRMIAFEPRARPTPQRVAVQAATRAHADAAIGLLQALAALHARAAARAHAHAHTHTHAHTHAHARTHAHAD